MLKICFSNSYVTKSLQGYSRKMSRIGVDILKRCSSSLRVLLYTIKRSLAKLNIEHRMCCNKPIDYKMLTKFFLDIIAWLYGEGGNSHILAYRMCHSYDTQFRLENEQFWVYF